ncbi:uncharacterized protein LOC109828828 [Asparagus officinalis]|uniref:uncharacterized protein LOC109828828 n=1 Tax=Asparagus officinalis TaxID=4686 RepID=UPI00098E03BE|nr:uncharacterized protein LOC109828828 [Asparagus officinalis]
MASALKIIWFIHVNKEWLWIKWIHGKYLKNTNIWLVNMKVGDSWMWKQLIKARDKAITICGGIENLKRCINSCCKNSSIQLSKLYSAISPVSNKVNWYLTVWDTLIYPKHSFILWLAVLNRLLTREKLLKRGIIQSDHCCLCSDNVQESRNHLFFDCLFSKAVWNNIMDWLKFKWRACDWDILMDWYTCRLRGKGFKQSLKRLALANTVYRIWRERNDRIFNKGIKNIDQITKKIKLDIMIMILNSSCLEENKQWLLSL